MNIALNEMYLLIELEVVCFALPRVLSRSLTPIGRLAFTFGSKVVHRPEPESIRIFLFIEVNNLRAKARRGKKNRIVK